MVLCGRVVREGLSEEVTFELTSGREDGASWGKELPDWTASAKALRAGTSSGFLRDSD